jgi:colicin import membrane protein
MQKPIKSQRAKEPKAGKKELKDDRKAKGDGEYKADKPARHAKSADEKELGRDDKGRTIYEGPRGGQYYYTDHGTKVYLKEEDKK